MMNKEIRIKNKEYKFKQVVLVRSKYVLYLLLILFTNHNIFAQQQHYSIQGTVKDSKTDETLVGATVMIDGTNQGITTDSQGVFVLKNIPESKQTLVISFIGYATQKKRIKLPIEKSQMLIFYLDEQAKDINEVVVTAKSEARQIREQAMPIAVISMNEIQGTASDINEVLAKTAGVKLRNTGGVGSSSRISVRGLEGKRIGYFIDETPMNDNSDFMDLNDIPIDMIERIEIYKGIVPAKFGGSAIGGAVNIVTKEYPPHYSDLSYTLASFNTHKANAILKRNKNGYRFGVGGFYVYSDNNYKMELPKEKGKIVSRNHDQFKKTTVGLSFISEKWWFDEIEFEAIYTKSQKQIQGIETYDFKKAHNIAAAYFFSLESKKENFFVPGLDFDLSNTYSYTQFQFIDKAMNRYDFAGNKLPPATFYGGEVGVNPSDANIFKHMIISKLNLNYIVNKWSSLNLNSVLNFAKAKPTDELKDKVIGYKTNFPSNMLSIVTGLNYETVFFWGKLTNSISAKHFFFDMKTQLREQLGYGNLANVHNQRSQWGMSEAIRYRFSTQFLLKASLAYDVRLPTENELVGDGFLIVPSGNLVPERNTSFNFGFMYDKSFSDKRHFQFEINGFYAYLKNMIRFVGGLLQSNYHNFGEMQTFGAEMEVKCDVASFLYLYGNATYQDLRDTRLYEDGSSSVANPNKGKRMPNIPYLFANVGVELHQENLFGGGEQNSRLFASGSFVEEYFYDFEQSIYQIRRIPRTLTFDAGIEHSFNNQRIIIGFQINNITNETVISEFNRPLPGRNFALKWRYIFK